MRNKIIVALIIIVIVYCVIFIIKKTNWNRQFEVGEVVDQINGIEVYHNGGVGNTEGRNSAEDGYNIGIKYQCVEFVKRYYFEHLNHKMPNSYGNAIDYYDKTLSDGDLNEQRNLLQYSNPSLEKPKLNDILIFDKSIFNSYGHVAIISKVEDEVVEIIQQNAGPFGASREKISLKFKNNMWFIQHDRVLGRLSIHLILKE